MTMSIHTQDSHGGESLPASTSQPSAAAAVASRAVTARPTAVADGVRAVLAPHEEAWRGSLRASLQEIAERQLVQFIAYWSTVQPGEQIPTGRDRNRTGDRQVAPAEGMLTYPRRVDGAIQLHARFGDEVHAARHGTVAVAGDVVRKEADSMFAEMRTSFIERAACKILHVAGTRPVERIEGNLIIHRAIEGSIIAHLDARNRVTFDAAVQTNYRYGEYSANRCMTQYHQYPFRVLEALVDGTFVSAPSADELAVRWGGLPAAQVERARIGAARAEKAAWTRTKDDLERQLYAWREVASTVSDHAKRLDLGTIAADPNHPQHAKMRRELEKQHANFLVQHSWFKDDPKMSTLRPLTEIHPMPRPLSLTDSYLQRLKLTAWPSPETAKAEVLRIRTALAEHKAHKPGPTA